MPRSSLRFLWVALVLVTVACARAMVASPAAPNPPVDPAARLRALAERYWQRTLEDFPETATFLGLSGDHGRLADNSLAARDARLAWLRRLRAEVTAVPEAPLGADDRVTRAMLLEEIDKELATAVCETPLWEVHPLGGPQVEWPRLAELQSLATPVDGQRLLARYRAMPRYLATHIANLRTGLARGYRPVRIAVERVLGQLDALLTASDSAQALLEPLRRRPAQGWPDDAWQAFTDSLRRTVHDDVLPAFARYRAFLASEALPRARGETEVGVRANPDGLACHRAQIRAQTSLPLEPDEVHRRGLEEMDRIHAEMRAITRRLFGTEDLPAVFRRLREDPRYTFASRDEIEATARTAVARAQAALPRALGRLPRTPVEVRRLGAFEEKDAPAAYYFPPAADGSRPGIYYVNTYDPRSRPRYTAEVLAFHEAIPGHHVQIALAQELEGVPEFRKHAGTTAFVEGWALYSERLADELGLYSDDLQRLGMLSFQAWRAARLVTDAGMHALGWSRQRAIDYMLATTALTPLDAANEIDRYIVWPGQALAYMTGQMEIRRLRREAEAALGPRFDGRGFHDVVLGAGAVTLPLLRARVEAWIAERRRAP